MRDGNYQPLKGQVALVTGASSGIGAGVAKALAHAGANVAINHPNAPEAAKKVVEEILRFRRGRHSAWSRFGRFMPIFLMRSARSISWSPMPASKKIRRLEDVLGRMAVRSECEPDRAISLRAEAAREFMRRGVVAERPIAAGKIICMSSVHEVIPWAGHCNYAASKVA